MSKIVGYTHHRSRTPFKFFWGIFFMLVVLFFAWLVSIDPAKQKKPIVTSSTRKSTTTTILEAAVAQVTAASSTTTTTTSTTTTQRLSQKPGEVKMVSQKFSRELVDNWPVNEAGTFAPGEKVYYHTAIDSPTVPLEIVHVWLEPDGSEHFSLNLTIRRQPGGTWSMISLPPAKTGRWTVKTLVQGKVLAEKSFSVE